MNDKKKWMGIFLLIGFLAGVIWIPGGKDVSYAADVTGVVTADSGLNVRSGTGTGYDILTKLPKGTKVTVQETLTINTAENKSEKWYKISVTIDGSTIQGYVLSTYIAIDAVASPTASPTPVPVPTAQPPAQTVTYRTEVSYQAINVAAKTLQKTNVYAKAGGKRKVISGKKITLNKNKSVKITAEKMVKGKSGLRSVLRIRKRNVLDIYGIFM